MLKKTFSTNNVESFDSFVNSRTPQMSYEFVNVSLPCRDNILRDYEQFYTRDKVMLSKKNKSILIENELALTPLFTRWNHATRTK